MRRKIIKIDEEKCDGCELCVDACHEGAIRMVDGKAKLVSDIYCDGLGDCLGECPQGAITIEEREAEAFDEEAVKERLARQKAPAPPAGGGCPGSAMKNFMQNAPAAPAESGAAAGPSRLGNWPVQLMLVPPGAPFLKGADILVCADCVPFAVPDFHARYLAGKALLVGCPKLDDNAFYEEKLKEIFAEAQPKSVTVLKMEVPCCGGIAQATVAARNATIPGTALDVITVGIRGPEILCEKVD